ncbi:unnamed protein product [Nesidiocoris tenuis]|uniref:RNA-directed DNA polymerase n=1 Tax=Nesidiocoris tenuis TaxID=355587 RepID=A0A6H5H2L1_9HEMI|nr:unnamed protein product [Nesidiocoris tenuis]CAB0009002.1 unnamed protein product [Nesidiocoris tenuis]
MRARSNLKFSQSRRSQPSTSKFPSRYEKESNGTFTHVDLERLGLKGLCLRCASRSHTARNCPNKRKLRCKSCLSAGHIARACIKTRLNLKNVKFIEESDRDNSDLDWDSEFDYDGNYSDEASINHVDDGSSDDLADDRIMVTLEIEGKPFRFECDSGSKYTIIDLPTFNRLNLQCPLVKSNLNLRSYTGHRFQPVGQASIRVRYKGTSALAKLYVVSFEKPAILGRQWIRLLNIMKLPDVNKISNEMNSNSKSPTSPEEAKNLLLHEFSDVFQEAIGEVPNYKISLQFKEKVQPIFLKPRSVPEAFRKIKEEIASDRILTPFNPRLPIVLATDASPVGLSGVLSHIMPNGDERPVTFVSRPLTKAENNYSQLDREATAVYWACKRLFDYLYGRPFTLHVDNKPIFSILHPNKKLPAVSASRLLRYAHFMSGFDYKISHRLGKENANADYLSRNPVLTRTSKPHQDDSYINQGDTIHHISNETVSAKLIAMETKNDPALSQLLDSLSTGELQDPQYSIKDGVILRGERVIIPESLQPHILAELHSTHIGIVRMKALARNYCFWKGIDRDIEDTVKSCRACCDVRNEPQKAPLHVWEPPQKNWQRIHMDYAGPFMKHQFFIVVDAKSKWPEVFAITSSPTTSTTIFYLKELITRHGLPEILVSDNAAIFRSSNFREFCERLGIRQRFIAPGNPSTNGQVERYCQTIKKKLKSMSHDSKSLQDNLQDLLFWYRATPLADGESPAQKMLGRNLRTKLDLLKPQDSQPPTVEHPTPPRIYQPGDRVQARNYASNVRWKYGRILRRLGNLHYMVELDDGYTLKRHHDQLRQCQVEMHQPRIQESVIRPIPIIPEHATAKSPEEELPRPERSKRTSMASTEVEQKRTSLAIADVPQARRTSMAIADVPQERRTSMAIADVPQARRTSMAIADVPQSRKSLKLDVQSPPREHTSKPDDTSELRRSTREKKPVARFGL